MLTGNYWLRQVPSVLILSYIPAQIGTYNMN